MAQIPLLPFQALLSEDNAAIPGTAHHEGAAISASITVPYASDNYSLSYNIMYLEYSSE